MNKFVAILCGTIASAGAFVGGYFVAKKKYEEKADKEVESVKKSLEEYFRKQDNTLK